MDEIYIGQLSAKSTPSSGDVLAIEDSEDTKKISYSNLANAVLDMLTSKKYSIADTNQTILAFLDTVNQKGFLERKVLNASDDMDNVVLGGIYRVTRGTPNWMPAHWPIPTSGGTILVFRWSGYGESSRLGTLQFVLTQSSTWIRWGGSVGISWDEWIEYKDYHTTIKPISTEFETEGVQDVHDYVIKDDELYNCIVKSNENEEWSEGKFRRTSIAEELKQLKSTIGIARHNLESGYYQFPLTWDKARTSNGDVVVESWSIINRRILSDYLPTESVDALKILDPFFDIGLALYGSDKQWISNMSIDLNQVRSVNGEKIIFLPRKPAYIRVCLVYKPDEEPNKFDISSIIKNNVFGIKYMLTNHCDPDTGTIRTRIPFGIGNFISNGDETFDYGQYRLRSGFLRSKDYSSIIVNNDSDYSYTINVRYLNDSLTVVKSDSYVDASKIMLEHSFPYFCLSVYNTANPNSTPLSPSHAISHIELSNDIGSSVASSNIISLNNEPDMTVKLQQISSNYSASSSDTVQPLTMLHFSDLHANTLALNRIIQFADYYDDYITDIIHTGDTLNSTATNFSFGNVDGGEKILNIIGNHDTWDSSITPETSESWRALNEADSYARFISPFVSNWGTGISVQKNKCYYYKDYPDNKVRLIVLDCMHENSAQLTWFTNALSSALSANLHVLIAAHVKMGKSEDMTYLESGFDNPVFPRSSTPAYNFPNYVGSDYVTAVDTFVQNGGIVVAWICGHMHCDTLATYHNVLNIAVTTAGDVSNSRTYDNRVQGTKSYDAFNVIGIDTNRNHLYLVRVGLDYNSIMRKIDTMCWNYKTHTLIHTS